MANDDRVSSKQPRRSTCSSWTRQFRNIYIRLLISVLKRLHRLQPKNSSFLACSLNSETPIFVSRFNSQNCFSVNTRDTRKRKKKSRGIVRSEKSLGSTTRKGKKERRREARGDERGNSSLVCPRRRLVSPP